MMRNDRLFKRIMKAGKPEPTLIFTNRVHRTLETLPEQGRKPALRFVPISAVAVVAFAAFCFFIADYAAQANRPAGSLQASMSAQPVRPTAGIALRNPSFVQKVAIIATENGIIQTIAQAGTDGYVLHLMLDYSPAPPTLDIGRIAWSLSVDGKPYITNSSLSPTGDNKNVGNYYEFVIPLVYPIQGDITHIALKTTILDETKKATVITFQSDFSLPVIRPKKVDASGEGMIVFGGKAALKSMYKSQDALVFVLDAEDDRNNFLRTYYDNHISANQGRVVFNPEYPNFFQMEVREGQADVTSYLLGTGQEDLRKAFNDARNGATNDPYRPTVFLEKGDDGRMLLTVVSYDPALHSGDKFTLQSKEFNYKTDTSDNAVIYTASGCSLNVKLQPEDKSLTATTAPAPLTTPAPSSSQTKAKTTGDKFFGYEARFKRIYNDSGATVIELDLTDDGKGSLEEFMGRGNGGDTVTYADNKPTHIALAIGEGNLDSKELGLILAPHEGREAQDAFELASGKLSIKDVKAMLQRGEGGHFTLSIICSNPTFKLDGGLTLISSTDPQAAYPDDSIDVLYIQPN